MRGFRHLGVRGEGVFAPRENLPAPHNYGAYGAVSAKMAPPMRVTPR